MKNRLFMTLCLLGCACISACNTASGTGGGSKEIDYGTLTIKDIDVFYRNDPDFLEIEFSKPEYKEKISYKFSGQLIEIKDDKVQQLKDGQRAVTVTAKTSHHETTFNVNLHNADSGFGTKALERSQKGWAAGGILFAGDSFFDSGHSNTWHNFYSDVAPIDDRTIFTTAVSGSNLGNWRAWCQKLITKPAPSVLLMNCGSNDFYDKGKNAEMALEDFKALMQDIRKHLPETEIYFYSAINRSSPINLKTKEQTLSILNEFNAGVKEFADNNDIKFVDIRNHFQNPDGSAKDNLLKDGCHPNDTEYEYFVNQAISLGAPIRWIGE